MGAILLASNGIGRPDPRYGLVSFLQTEQEASTSRITQVSQQINFYHYGGWQARSVIFDLMDQEPRSRTTDMWTLVNAKQDADGQLTEIPGSVPACGPGSIPIRRTAPLRTPGWKAASSSTMWISAMTDEKIVLHNISLYAKPGQKIAFVGSYRCRQDDNHQPDQPIL